MCQSCGGFSAAWKPGWEELRLSDSSDWQMTDTWLNARRMEGREVRREPERSFAALQSGAEGAEVGKEGQRMWKWVGSPARKGGTDPENLSNQTKGFRGLSLFAQDGLVSEIKGYCTEGENTERLLLRSPVLCNYTVAGSVVHWQITVDQRNATHKYVYILNIYQTKVISIKLSYWPSIWKKLQLATNHRTESALKSIRKRVCVFFL